MTENRVDTILHHWFGNAENTSFPSEERTAAWFGGDVETDKDIKRLFAADVIKAANGDYAEWEQIPRSLLALIILLDQFPRHLYRGAAGAFEHDSKALSLCLKGIEHSYDHELSLIERVFFYFPLMHSEDLEMQILSVRAYQMLAAISFPETRELFEKFLDYAIKHRELISRFGRFPYRNETLGRTSTAEELAFLKESGRSWWG